MPPPSTHGWGELSEKGLPESMGAGEELVSNTRKSSPAPLRIAKGYLSDKTLDKTSFRSNIPLPYQESLNAELTFSHQPFAL
jgi:hypothetical protein